MRILIAGAGIAGSAAALALHKAGFEPVVYEAHPRTGADIGAFLTLASNGMLALGQVDAADAVASAGFELTSMQVSDEHGKSLAVVPLGLREDPLTRYRCLRRAELGAVLQVEVGRRGIPIHHGHRIVGLQQDSTGVTAVFADGTSDRGDLLLGADGLNSAVRTMIDPDASPPRYAGQNVYYGYTAAGLPVGAAGRIDMVRGSAVAFGFATAPTGQIYWFGRVSAPELGAEQIRDSTAAACRERLLPLLQQDSTPSADIVAATADELMVTNAADLPSVRRWRSGRVLLIGDAAHAASPATGQGASMALEDAVILAKALRGSADPGAAFSLYERHRRPRVEQNIRTSARLTARRPPDPDAPRAMTDEEVARHLDWEVQLAG